MRSFFKTKNLTNILFILLFITCLKLLFNLNRSFYFDNNNNLSKIIIQENINSVKYFKNFCASVYNFSYDLNKASKFNKQNITLLITFNRPPSTSFVRENLIFLNEFYRSFFKNIIFCGPNLSSLNLNSKSYKLLDCDTDKGFMHYRCMSMLIETNDEKTNGILLMSDDVLLKYWNLNVYKTDRIWYPEQPKFITLNDWFQTEESWIHTEYGEIALVDTFNYIDKVLNKSIKIDHTSEMILTSFIQLLRKNTNQNDKITKFSKSASDIFYVPNNLFKQFNIVSKLFSKYNVFLEIAVPIILTGLDKYNLNENSWNYKAELVFTCVIVLLALPTNIYIILFSLRKVNYYKNLKNFTQARITKSFHTFLIEIYLFDTIIIIFLIINTIFKVLHYFEKTSYDSLYDMSNFACKFFTFTVRISGAMSNYLVFFLALTRCTLFYQRKKIAYHKICFNTKYLSIYLFCACTIANVFRLELLNINNELPRPVSSSFSYDIKLIIQNKEEEEDNILQPMTQYHCGPNQKSVTFDSNDTSLFWSILIYNLVFNLIPLIGNLILTIFMIYKRNKIMIKLNELIKWKNKQNNVIKPQSIRKSIVSILFLLLFKEIKCRAGTHV